MSRRNQFSSHDRSQFPRRSSRERQALYMSLDENFLFGPSSSNSVVRSLVDQANKSQYAINDSYIIPQSNYGGYSTRSKNRICVSNYCVPVNGHSDDEIGFENNDIGNKKRSKLLANNENMHTSMLNSSGENGVNSKTEAESNDISKEASEPNMYESVKQRRQAMRQATASLGLSNKSSARNMSRRRKKDGSEEMEEQQNGAPEDEDGMDSDDNEPRHYALRTHRNPVSRFCIEPSARSSRNCVLRRVEAGDVRPSARRGGNTRKRCYGRSDSSSNSDSEDGVQQHKQSNEEGRYDRRDLRRINKARSRLMPVNLGDDYTSLTMNLRDVLRRKAGSDTDPVKIDVNVNFAKVGGLESHIHSLKEIVLFPLLYPELFSMFEIAPPKGVLFHGPPGTGKTLVARALANACSTGEKKVAFFMRKGADCLSKWVGESEKQLRMLFDQAYSMRPSIIFFDEIDGLAPVRSSKQDQIHSSIVSTLLALMDGLDNRGEVVVIGATNRLDAIDPALRRPGRFDRELRFNLPDKNARMEILKIHTSSWNTTCRPSENDLQWLAMNTSGYCGADLKALCTETVLVALRARFPQIYTTQQKLDINPNVVTIKKEDFVVAMRNTVPSGHRDFSIPSRQLSERLSLLSKKLIDSIVNAHIPEGYLQFQSHDAEKSAVERIADVYRSSRVIPCARLLLYGSSSDMGQTSYILPVIINRLDHLPIYSLALSNLFSSGAPEQTLAHIIQAAIRTSSNGTPAVLLVTSIDKWYLSVPSSVWYLLLTALDSFTGFTSIMVLATAECDYTNLPSEVHEIFRSNNSVQICPPPSNSLEVYFNNLIMEPSCTSPRIFNPEAYPELPPAKLIQPTCQFNGEELKELRKMYDQYRLELVLHYEETIARLSRDRRFQMFAQPVDAGQVPDYYIHIKNPMDLSKMFSKACQYRTPEEFLDDFRLIHDNAIEYNPMTDFEGRQIRIAAKLLFDMGKRAVFELDSKFLKRIGELKKILTENGVELEDSSTAVNNMDISSESNSNSSVTMDGDITPNGKTPTKRRASNEQKSSGRKRRCFGKSVAKKDVKHSPDQYDLRNAHSDNERSFGASSKSATGSKRSSISTEEISPSEPLSKKPPAVKIDHDEMLQVVQEAVVVSKNWPLGRLERFAAELSQTIDRFTNTVERMDLPKQLMAVIRAWKAAKNSS